MADYVDNTIIVDVNEVVLSRQDLSPVVESNFFCEDCEDEIPEERRKEKNVTLCTHCKQREEKLQQR